MSVNWPFFRKYSGLLLLLSSVGCGAHHARSAWMTAHGGLADEQTHAHVRRVAGTIIATNETITNQRSVHVLDTDELAAYSWNDGQVYVTRGLVKLLDEEELRAVIAHELGHLLKRVHSQVVSALQGCEQDIDAESRADLVGIELLKASGTNPEAMPRMLRRIITSHCWSSECELKLKRRLHNLTRSSK